MKENLPKEDNYFLKDKEKVFFLTGIYIFGQSLFIWFLSYFFNPDTFLISTIIALSVFFFSYLIYFSPLAKKIQHSASSPWMSIPYPFAVFLAMLLVPQISVLIMAIFFVIIFPIILEFDRKKVVPFFIGLSLLLIGVYFFIFDKNFSLIEHIVIFLWVCFSYIAFTIMEYFFSAEVYHQRDEIHQLQNLSANLTLERDKLGFVISTMRDAVIVLDPEESIVVFNQAAEEITFLKAEDALGKQVDTILKLTYHGSPFSFSSLVNSQQKPASLAISSNSGKEVEVEPLLKKIDLPDSAAQYVLTLRNLTKEKELEKLRLNFVTIAAHELRTPITYIRGYLSFLLDSAKQKLSPEEQSFLEKSYVGTNNLSSLTENLLTVSNIQTKSLAFHKTLEDWGKIVRDVIEKYKTIAAWKGVEITTDLGEKPLPKVMVDQFKISEVLENLLANAIEYNHEKGTVEVSVQIKDKQIVTAIKDSGIGIPKEKLPELFTEFFRFSGPLIQASKGAGLGLFISKYIVENHAGKIWVESKLGRGSTFYFSLPLPT